MDDIYLCFISVLTVGYENKPVRRAEVSEEVELEEGSGEEETSEE